MESNKYNTLVLTGDEFDNLYVEVANVLRVLTRAGYVCVVYEEDCGIIRIDYNYAEYNHFGNPLPIWFDDKELEIIDFCLSYYGEDNNCCCKCNN